MAVADIKENGSERNSGIKNEEIDMREFTRFEKFIYERQWQPEILLGHSETPHYPKGYSNLQLLTATRSLEMKICS